MKRKFYFLMCTLCLLAVGASAQVVDSSRVLVKIPEGCQIIHAGLGGDAALRLAGDGAVIAMPENLQEGFTIHRPAGLGFLRHTWHARGDLKIVSAVANRDTVRVKSHNMHPRETEGGAVFPFASSNGRSPGHLRFSYDYTTTHTERIRIDFAQLDTLCGCNCDCACECEFDHEFTLPGSGNVGITVFKTFEDRGSLPPIVGPACPEKGEEVTYSVDHILSDNTGSLLPYDSYTWQLFARDSAGKYRNVLDDLSIYYSTDSSSITFILPKNIEQPGILTCSFGQYNAKSALDGDTIAYGTSAALVLRNRITKPEFTLPACIGMGTEQFTITLENPIPQGQEYSWTDSRDVWKFTPDLANNAFHVIKGNGLPDNLILTINDDVCGERIFNTPMVYGIDSKSAISYLDGSGSVVDRGCFLGGSAYTFMLSGGVRTSVHWTLPDSTWQLTPLQADSSEVSIFIPFDAKVGENRIYAETLGCPEGRISKVISVTPQKPVFVEGYRSCFNRKEKDTVTYSVLPVGKYTWEAPRGWKDISSRDSCNVITLVTDGKHDGIIRATPVTDAKTCPGESSEIQVQFNPIKPELTVGCSSYGVDGRTIVTVANPPRPWNRNGRYEVTYPEGVVSRDSRLNDSTLIVLHTKASAPVGTYPFWVQYKEEGNMCPEGAVAEGVLTIDTHGMELLVYKQNPRSSFYVAEILGFVSGCTTDWYADGKKQPVVHHATIQIPASEFHDNVTAFISKDGCTVKLEQKYGQMFSFSLPGVSGPSTQSVRGGVAPLSVDLATSVTLYPNPNSGEFTVVLPSIEGTAVAQLVDNAGKVYGRYTLRAGENRLEVSVAPGVYYLGIAVEGQYTVRRLVINH